MIRYYLKKAEKCHHLEGLIADLEIRLSALKGDEIAIQVIKETKQEKIETLESHIKNLQGIHNYINQFFEVWVKDTPKTHSNGF